MTRREIFFAILSASLLGIGLAMLSSGLQTGIVFGVGCVIGAVFFAWIGSHD